MPFNEALFWFGITAFGTGLYFLVEASVKRLHPVALTVAGFLACAYAVYRHYHHEIPAIPLWMILLVLTWAFLGYAIYLGQFRRSVPLEDTEVKRLATALEQAKKELGAEKAAAQDAPQFSDLAKRTLNLANQFRQEVKAFRAEHPQPRFPSRLSRGLGPQISSPIFRDDDVNKALADFNAWKQRAGAWYRNRFLAALQGICDELGIQGLTDSQLNTAITETSLDEENTGLIIQRLRYLALQLDDDPADKVLLAGESQISLEVRLLGVAHGASLDVNGSTLFFRLGVFSEVDAGLRRIAVHLKINGKHYDLEPIEELAGWKREAPMKPAQPYHHVIQSNMSDSDLRKGLRAFGINANKEAEGYIAVYVPELIPKVLEKIQLVRLEFSVTKRIEPYQFTFSEIREDEATIRPEGG